MNSTQMPAPLDHYTATIRDLNTIIVTAHFIDNEEGFVPQVGAAHMTINLGTPLSVIDDNFRGSEGGQAYEPCDLSEFYAHSDDDTNRAIMIAEGKDPDAEEAKWAEDEADSDEKERLWFCGNWTSVEAGLPEEQELVLVITRNSPNAVIAQRYKGRWMLFNPSAHEPPVVFWTAVPKGPDH